MVLATHAVAGAVLASFFPKYPLLAFCVGFFSHFLLDAIPHWDYHLASLSQDQSDKMNTDMKLGRVFAFDLLKIAADVVLGFVFTFLLFLFFGIPLHTAFIFGAFGGIAPDFLQFVYMKWKHEPLLSLQKFHMWIHSKISLKGRYLLGPLLQVLFLFMLIFIVLKK